MTFVFGYKDVESLIGVIHWYSKYYYRNELCLDYIKELSPLLEKLRSEPLSASENDKVELIQKIVDGWLDY